MSFPLYFDEHVQRALAEMLTARGHDVLTARDAGRAGRGISDEDQLQYAADNLRVMVSYNAGDFMLLASEWQRLGKEHAGILLSPERQPEAQLPRFLKLFELYPSGFPPNLCMQLPPAG